MAPPKLISRFGSAHFGADEPDEEDPIEDISNDGQVTQHVPGQRRQLPLRTKAPPTQPNGTGEDVEDAHSEDDDDSVVPETEDDDDSVVPDTDMEDDA